MNMNDNPSSIREIQKNTGVILAFFVCMAMCLPYHAFAFFSELEGSYKNTFGASSLGIALSVTAQTEDSRTVAVLADQEEAVEYQVAKTDATGVFCADLQMEVSKDGVGIFDGSLTTFVQSTSSALQAGESDVFEYVFSVADDDAVYAGACAVTFTYKANQAGYAFGQAFFDTETDAFVLQASDFGATPSAPAGVVLNEVLANPEGADDQGGLQGEWVELYNNSTVSVDLTGWYIKDLAGHTIPITAATTMNGRTSIGAVDSGTQWVVVYMNGEILNNTGDTVTLYNASSTVMDSYAFGGHDNDTDPDSHHTGGGDNDGPTGDETAANEGKSDARIPDGTGTWIDPIPTPGGYNILEETAEVATDDGSRSSFIFSSEILEVETIVPVEMPPEEEDAATIGSEGEEEIPKEEAPKVTEGVNGEGQEEGAEGVPEEQPAPEPKEEPEQPMMRPEESSVDAIEPTQTEIE